MTKEKKGTGEDLVTGTTQNTGLTVAAKQKEMLKMFEQVADEELIELTSAILKLEEGEVWNGIVTREKQAMKSTDEKGEDYEGYVGYNSSMEKTVLADSVVIGAFDDYFGKYPAAENALCRISCKGMKKSAKDAKKEYRDLTVRIAPPQAQIEA